jgi:hypothetical protein
MRISQTAFEVALVIFWGAVLSFLLPYARLQIMPIRVLIIFLGYVTCFGSFLYLNKRRSGAALDWNTAGRFALISAFVLVALGFYERARTTNATSWVAIGVLSAAVFVSTLRTRRPSHLLFSGVVILVAVLLYLLAKT